MSPLSGTGWRGEGEAGRQRSDGDGAGALHPDGRVAKHSPYGSTIMSGEEEPPQSVGYDLEAALELLAVLEDARET